ncbi:glycosyltransferase family 90 protein [Suillus cothurnatus]|nr:glycosyltransferase family 90 protein [Suillus cothurnatus]
MFPFRIARRSLRTYIFLVTFAATFILFSLAPTESVISTEPPPPRPTHIFRPDGLLQVNPGGRHPILDLIDHAEKEWDAKLARASKTLPDAVREYHRRYSRAPPPGFDKWWAYVQKHNVQLPDEYDQINTDLAPYWGIIPERLQAIQLAHEGHVQSYTLAKSTPSGPIHIGNESLPADQDDRRVLLTGAIQLMDLMKGVQDELPLFRAVFSPHDNPNVFVTHDMRKKLQSTPNPKTHPPYTRGWIHACPLNSVARNPPASLFPRTTKPKTFIHDHFLAMDPCAHPSHLLQHGEFLSHGPGPSAYPFPVPQFSYCSSPLHADIRVPIMLSWVEDVDGGEDVWIEKEEERLLWRGLNTGIHHGKEKPWKDAQRDRLMDLVSSPPSSNSRPQKPFAGKPGQCEPEVCKEVEERWEWRRRMGVKEAGRYKYVLDVDGNGWSSRFKRLMTSNSVVFKSTVYPEWFTQRIAPWVHYIPIQIDYSDLYDALIFFRGDPSGHGAHEDLANKIAGRAREWSLKFWRKEDMVAYLYRLLLEYARVMDENRDSLNFELEL